MQRSARAKARAAERRAALEMTKAENKAEKFEADKATETSTSPDETIQQLPEAESNQGELTTKRKPTEQATYSPTPETSISGPIPDVYNPAGADKLSLHRTKRFFRKNTLKLKRTQVRRV